MWQRDLMKLGSEGGVAGKIARRERFAPGPPAALAAGWEVQTSDVIRKVLDSARRYLDMDVAFLGQLTEGQEFFHVVVGDGQLVGVTEGAAMARSETYCDAMISGRIGMVVPDSTAEPALADLAATKTGRIGRYVGVPIHLPRRSSLWGPVRGRPRCRSQPGTPGRSLPGVPGNRGPG